MSSTAISPNWREILSAQSDITGRQEYLTSHNGALNINGSFSIAGSPLPIAGATTAIVTAIVDSSGNQIDTFGGGTQYQDGDSTPADPVGTGVVFDSSGVITFVSDATPLPVSGSFSPSGLQDVNITQVGGNSVTTAVPVSGIVDLGTIGDVATETTLATINAKLVSGTDIGDVTVNNAGGAAAVNIQDGGNSITVDGTVAATQSGAWTVTANAGTDLSTSALLTTTAFNAAFGTAGSADAQVLSIQGIASMTPVQVSQATASNLNATVVGTGTFAVQAAQSGTWTVQPGNTANTTAWLVTGTGGTFPITDSGGSITVDQPTGSNLHTVIDSGTITAVTAITNALPTGNNNIGDVDVASVVPGTAAANLGKAEDSAHASGDTGVAVWGVRNDNASTTFGADQDYTPLSTDLKGRTLVVQKAPTATLANVASSASSVTILAANSARVGATVYNDSTQILYLKFGATASATSFTVPLATNTYYEVPAGYSGIIDGIWASANGNARVTEMT